MKHTWVQRVKRAVGIGLMLASASAASDISARDTPAIGEIMRGVSPSKVQLRNGKKVEGYWVWNQQGPGPDYGLTQGGFVASTAYILGEKVPSAQMRPWIDERIPLSDSHIYLVDCTCYLSPHASIYDKAQVYGQVDSGVELFGDQVVEVGEVLQWGKAVPTDTHAFYPVSSSPSIDGGSMSWDYGSLKSVTLRGIVSTLRGVGGGNEVDRIRRVGLLPETYL